MIAMGEWVKTTVKNNVCTLLRRPRASRTQTRRAGSETSGCHRSSGRRAGTGPGVGGVLQAGEAEARMGDGARDGGTGSNDAGSNGNGSGYAPSTGRARTRKNLQHRVSGAVRVPDGDDRRNGHGRSVQEAGMAPCKWS